MCSSNKCLVAGKNKTEHDNSSNNNEMTYYQACCAWDLHVWLYGDSTMKDERSRLATGHDTRSLRYLRYIVVESVSTIRTEIQLVGRFDMGIWGVCGVGCELYE
eukprot:scaffold344454_cov119-Cyclotella_meneghiniana.AAC.1